MHRAVRTCGSCWCNSYQLPAQNSFPSEHSRSFSVFTLQLVKALRMHGTLPHAPHRSTRAWPECSQGPAGSPELIARSVRKSLCAWTAPSPPAAHNLRHAGIPGTGLVASPGMLSGHKAHLTAAAASELAKAPVPVSSQLEAEGAPQLAFPELDPVGDLTGIALQLHLWVLQHLHRLLFSVQHDCSVRAQCHAAC